MVDLSSSSCKRLPEGRSHNIPLDHHFPVVSYGFPMVFLWYSYGFPMVTNPHGKSSLPEANCSIFLVVKLEPPKICTKKPAKTSKSSTGPKKKFTRLVREHGPYISLKDFTNKSYGDNHGRYQLRYSIAMPSWRHCWQRMVKTWMCVRHGDLGAFQGTHSSSPSSFLACSSCQIDILVIATDRVQN